MKEHHAKKAMSGCPSECSTSFDSTFSPYSSECDSPSRRGSKSSVSADSSPCSSECGSPARKADFSPWDTDDSLEKNVTPKGLESEPEANSESKVLTPCACRWSADELVKQQVLMEGEEIVLCGNVVRRGFPLLRKNVLVLTSMPRLLVLNPSCSEVLKQIPLRRDDTSLVTQGARDFQVRTLDKIYDCRDVTLGADVWKHHVQAARNKVKQGRFF